MRRTRRALLAVAMFALLLPALTQADNPSGFRFHVPPGWLDLSPGAPSENLMRAAPMTRQRALDARADQTLLFFAVSPNSDALMIGYLRPLADSEPLDADALARARSQLGWHGIFRTDEARIDAVNGLNWGRFTGKTGTNEENRFVAYLIPGRPRSAFVLLAAPISRFDEFLPAFEQAARSTEGAQNPEPKSHAPVGTEIVTLALVALTAFGAIRLRRRSTKRASRNGDEREGRSSS